MKRRYLTYFMALLFFVSCYNDSDKMPQNDSISMDDTIRFYNGVDSMPVIKPSVNDSEAVLITPPVNDDNAVVPD